MNAWGSYLRDFHVRLYRFLETSRGVDLDSDGVRRHARATSYFLVSWTHCPTIESFRRFHSALPSRVSWFGRTWGNKDSAIACRRYYGSTATTRILWILCLWTKGYVKVLPGRGFFKEKSIFDGLQRFEESIRSILRSISFLIVSSAYRLLASFHFVVLELKGPRSSIPTCSTIVPWLTLFFVKLESVDYVTRTTNTWKTVSPWVFAVAKESYVRLSTAPRDRWQAISSDN